MSERNVLKGMKVKVNRPSDDKNANPQNAKPSVFYRRPCSGCGKDELDLIDSGIFTRSPILGITSDGEIGCSSTELEGDCELGIYCRDCGHQVCSESSLTNKCSDEFLSEWAKSAIAARPALPFACSTCDSPELHQVEVGIESSHAVVAVCEADAPGNAPLIAVSHQRETGGRGTYRYRCSQGHELVKEDGTPVETAEELADWLKAHASGEKK
jgi:hypothetical protein